MNVTVVDVESGRLLPNRSVVVTGTRITEVVAAADCKAPDGAIVVAAAGKYLIPGLWDMHVHIHAPMPWLLDMFVVNGVTGIRELNSESFLLAWRDEIRSGKRLGPRIVASGLYLDATRAGQPPTRPTADTPEQGRELVRQRKKQGVDFIKVYTGLQPDVYRAVLEEAKVQGLPVAGHCPEMVSAREASNLGQRSIEHVVTGIPLSTSRMEEALREDLRNAFHDPQAGYDLDRVLQITISAMGTPDEQKQAELFALFKKNRTWQVPKLVVHRPGQPPSQDAAPDPRMKYMHPELTQLWGRLQASAVFQAGQKAQFDYSKAAVRAMHKAGVPILAGTDCSFLGVNVYPGFGLADELELLVDCGLKPDDALRAATVNPAVYLDEEATSGTVAVGKRADLVLLDSDPLSEIGNVRKIAGVMARGKWLSRADLDKMLSDLQKAAGN